MDARYGYYAKTSEEKEMLQHFQELLKEGNRNDPDEYIFSLNLSPGPVQINSEKITRRWKNHVKNKLGITADFYTLKHRFIDQLDAMSAAAPIIPLRNPAQEMAGHKSDKMTDVYAHGRASRERELLKKIKL